MSPVAIQSPQPLTEYSSQHPSLELVGSHSFNFDNLISSIRDVLGPDKDLKSEDVDVDKLQLLMKIYKSTRSEWERYSFIDLSRNYTRNLVDNLNGNANLVCYNIMTLMFVDVGW